MSDEAEPNSESLARIREFRAFLLPKADVLRGKGLEVDVLLADLDHLIAALEGRAEAEFDPEAMMARLTAFVEEMGQAAHLQKQAEAVQAIVELPGYLAEMEKLAEVFHTHGGRMEEQSASALEAALANAREELRKGQLPAAALEDMALTVGAQQAEFARRLRYRSIMLALYWEQNPPERWAALSPESKAKMEELLALWRRDREKLLGELPIEDRRRLEAMRGEDFEQPESWKP